MANTLIKKWIVLPIFIATLQFCATTKALNWWEIKSLPCLGYEFSKSSTNKIRGPQNQNRFQCASSSAKVRKLESKIFESISIHAVRFRYQSRNREGDILEKWKSNHLIKFLLDSGWNFELIDTQNKNKEKREEKIRCLKLEEHKQRAVSFEAAEEE